MADLEYITRFGDDNYTQEQVDEKRKETLELEKINQNSTIQDMIETIDSNFRNIAMHGGGPSGKDGKNGLNGIDGTNVEYIYCLCDTMIAGEQYPTEIVGFEDLFSRAKTGEAKYNNVYWYDHALPISKEHPDEYVLIRYKNGNSWSYEPAPVLWAHWGETGQDGDGVEYIFLATNRTYNSESELKSLLIKKEDMSTAQKALFQIDGFFPGSDWFISKNWSVAKTALKDSGLLNEQFEELWARHFDFFTNDTDWTDNPTGVSPVLVNEYVAIRRSSKDENDKKVWSDFSTPSLWANYNLPSRTFILYCNTDTDTPPSTPKGGWWDIATDTLVRNKEGHVLTPSSWSDTDIEQSGKITWMSSGIFDNTGKNVSWTKAIRITGKDGENGADGSTIEFIYALSDTMVAGDNYPTENIGDFFDVVERDHSNTHNSTTWYDNPQGITETNKTEYVWVRQKNGEGGNWEYSSPTVWSHWGEDGTDGDGVEYIFYITDNKDFNTRPRQKSSMTGTMGKYQKALFQLNDFYPGIGWFRKGSDHKINVKNKLASSVNGFDESYFNTQWDDDTKLFNLNEGWTDNPTGINVNNQYEFVSIRKSTNDENGKRVWEDFSEPKLWSSYNKRIRFFIAYYNGTSTTPTKPAGGWWDVINDTLVTDKTGYALTSGWSDTNVEESGKITWMSTGTFYEDNDNTIWSEPHRITGAKGENGRDGSDIQYIYALSDSMSESTNYPAPGHNKVNWKDLFDAVEDPDNAASGIVIGTDSVTGEKYVDYNGTHWYDRARIISKEHKTEYCWSRKKLAGSSEFDEYDNAPFVWAHWGEDGTDGDGVEYIFHLSNDNSIVSGDAEYPVIPQSNPSTDDERYKKIIYNLDDFYPGDGWFTTNESDKKTRVQNAFTEAGLAVPSDFNTRWANNFGFNSGVNSWTDNPSSVSVDHPYEFVSIRRSNTDSNGNKVWGEFSAPAIWANYGKATRVFMVYCNIPKDNISTVIKPVGGFWNTETGRLALDSEHQTTDYTSNALETMPSNPTAHTCIWENSNYDVSNTITYIASGIFSEDGSCISWSEPHRITGPDGINGTDGGDMQFIYALFDADALTSGVHFPSTNQNTFFQNVENNGYADFTSGTGQSAITVRWYDTARSISKTDKIEFCWSRHKASNSDWTVDGEPFIWARWGEDGTDGDGIEYIFTLRQGIWKPTAQTWTTSTTVPNTDTAKAAYSMHEFIPCSSWFTANETAVQSKMGSDFSETDWNAFATLFSFDNKSLGEWTDNPEDLGPENPYLYVSIRKYTDGEWSTFSYPTLWSKYNVSEFTSFVFTTAKIDVDLSIASVSGGSFLNPTPDDTNYGNITYHWSDTPGVIGNGDVVWMTFAKIKEDVGTMTWAAPRRLSDTSEFNVEWSASELTPQQVSDINASLRSNNNVPNVTPATSFKDYFDFGKILALKSYDEAQAEQEWRNRMYNVFNGVSFSDQASNAVIMATCQMENGVWNSWTLIRVKGEKGEEGTSINMKSPITYEIYLDNGASYTISSARTKFNAVKSTLTTPTPSEGYLAIVYPHDVDTNSNLYRGDESLGSALYMCKYTNSSWVEYYDSTTVSSTDEEQGDTHPSPNGHLILWDGDSWMDVGNIVGPEGPEGTSWKISVAYANGEPGNRVPAQDQAAAKWIGILVYPDNGTDYPSTVGYNDTLQDSDYIWSWSLFKGQDGYGYEYIFKATETNTAPSIPTHNTSWEDEANVVPESSYDSHPNFGWSDDPIEPSLTNKYIWMCWRKFDHSTGKWTPFTGKENTQTARLWQVYANSISTVTEYFYSSDTNSPTWSGDNSTSTSIDTSFWKPKANVTWDSTYRYLFNREVVTYSDGTMSVLEPHLVATWEDGIIDVVDYYILESAAGTSGHDPGEVAPHYSNSTPTITGSSNPGKDYWATSVPKMDADYPVLWNISLKTYEDNRTGVWTIPIVIGTYGEGVNGIDAVYADLENDMDSIQINESNMVLENYECSTTVKLYSGLELMRIDDIDISGEDSIVDSYTLVYYHDDGTGNRIERSGGITGNHDVNCIKIVFNILKDTVFTDAYTKIVISVGHSEGNNETVRRSVTYTLAGTTLNTIYSIVPSATAVLFKNTGTVEHPVYVREPNPITLAVMGYTGSNIDTYTRYSSSQKFKLFCNNSQLSSGEFKVFTSNLSAGDSLTFRIDVDSDSNGTYETTVDNETIYVLKEGTDGAPGISGTNGNGYRYYYARYNNASASSYGSETIPSIATSTLASDTPIFLLNNVRLSTSTNAQGADENHTFEYRTERYFDGSNWSSWSNPIVIAKYLTASNISVEVNQAVTAATQSMQQTLNDATTAINTLSGYFDGDGKLNTSNFPSGVLSGFISKSSLSDEINTIGVGGLMVDANGNTSLFGYLNDSSTGVLTAIGQDINALSGELSTYATQVNTSLNEVATAIDTFKVDAEDRFASLERTVANGTFVTDTDGNLLVEIPNEYTTWYSSENYLSGDTRPVEWVLTHIFESEEGDEAPGVDTLVPVVSSINDLHDESGENWMFILKKKITISTNLEDFDDENFVGNNLYPYINDSSFTDELNEYVTINLNNTKTSYGFTIGDGASYLLSGIETSVTGDGNVTIVMYATVNLNDENKVTKDSNGNYICTNLDWSCGISECPSSYYYGNYDENYEGICDIAYSKTDYIFHRPLMITPSPLNSIKRDIEKCGHFGCTIARNINGIPYAVESYGNITVNSPMMTFIPENTSLQNIMNYLKNGVYPPSGSIQTDRKLKVGESVNYYVAAHYDSVNHLLDSDGKFTYGDLVSDNPNISSPNNTVTYQYTHNQSDSSPLFKNRHTRTVDSSYFTDDNEYRTFEQYDEGGVVLNTSETYSMYVTSLTDKVDLTIDCEIEPKTSIDEGEINNGGETIDSEFIVNFVYWYGSDTNNSKTINISHIISDSNETYSGSFDLFNHIPLTPDSTLNFKIEVSCRNLISVRFSYKFTTVNRLLVDKQSNFSIPDVPYTGDEIMSKIQNIVLYAIGSPAVEEDTSIDVTGLDWESFILVYNLYSLFFEEFGPLPDDTFTETFETFGDVRDYISNLYTDRKLFKFGYISENNIIQTSNNIASIPININYSANRNNVISAFNISSDTSTTKAKLKINTSDPDIVDVLSKGSLRYILLPIKYTLSDLMEWRHVLDYYEVFYIIAQTTKYYSQEDITFSDIRLNTKFEDVGIDESTMLDVLSDVERILINAGASITINTSNVYTSVNDLLFYLISFPTVRNYVKHDPNTLLDDFITDYLGYDVIDMTSITSESYLSDTFNFQDAYYDSENDTYNYTVLQAYTGSKTAIIFERVKEILHEQFDIDPNTVEYSSRFVNDFNLDENDMVILEDSVETEYGIDIIDQDMESILSISDLVEYINNAVNISTSYNFTTAISCDVVDELTWETTSDDKRRTSSYLQNYVIDKVTITVNDRSAHPFNTTYRRLALNNNGQPTASYLDVCKEDKPYLVTSVSELASISQMVSDGIASTSIIVGVGDHASTQLFQATENGSSIYLNADEIEIRSNYFKLNNDGLEMSGNLLAKDDDNNITAGVIGEDIAQSNDVKFFAGYNEKKSPISRRKIMQVYDAKTQKTYIYVRYPDDDVNKELAWAYDLCGDNQSISEYVVNPDAENNLDQASEIYTSSNNVKIGDIYLMVDRYVTVKDVTMSTFDESPFCVYEDGSLHASKGKIGQLEITDSGLKYEDDGSYLYISNQGLTIRDKDDNLSILSANGLKMTGTFASRTAHLVYGMNGNKDKLSEIKKEKHIYSTIFPEDLETVFTKYDIINIFGRGYSSSTSNIQVQIPDTKDLIGRKFTVIVEPTVATSVIDFLRNDTNGQITLPYYTSTPVRVTLSINGGCKFYMDGGTADKLILYYEVAELLGVGDIDGNFDGFIVTNKYSINKSKLKEQGHNLKCLGMFKISANASTPILAYSTYNGKSGQVTYSSSNSYFDLLTPFKIDDSMLNNIMVTVSPEDSGTSTACYQTVLSKTSENELKITVYGSSSANIRKTLKVIIFNLDDFQFLTLDTNTLAAITSKLYKLSSSSVWYTISTSGLKWDYSSTSVYQIKIHINEATKKVEFKLDQGSGNYNFTGNGTYANYIYTYETNGDEEDITIGTIKPFSINSSTTTQKVGRLSITVYNSNNESNTIYIPLTQYTKPSGGSSGGSSGGDYSYRDS